MSEKIKRNKTRFGWLMAAILLGGIGVALWTRPALSDPGNSVRGKRSSSSTSVSAPRTSGTTVTAPRGGTSDGKGSNDFTGTSGKCSGGGLTTNCGIHDTKSTCEGASKCAGGLTSGCGKFTTKNGCSSAGNCNGKVGSIGSGCGDFSSSNACTSSHTCKGRTATTSGCKKLGSKSSCEDERKCTGTTFDSKIACPLHKTKSKCKSHDKCRWTRKCDWEPRGCSWKQKDCRWESKGCKWEKSKPRSCGFSKRVAHDIWTKFDKSTREAGCLSPVKIIKGSNKFPYLAPASGRFLACTISVGKLPAKIAGKMKNYWNSMAKGGWANIGPRRLGEEPEKGTIKLGAHRKFFTDAPVNTGEFTLSLKKRGGKARTEVTVCLTTADGKMKNIWQFDSAKGDENDGTKWKKTFKNMEGVVAVKISSKDATKDFQYTIESKAEPRKYNFGKVKGYADLHVHQTNSDAFGGNFIHGNYRLASTRMKKCTARDHLIPFPMHGTYHGFPNEGSLHAWPRYNDVSHSQVSRDWLKRAHASGMKLMVMPAEDFQPICYLLKAIHPNKRTKKTCGDMGSVRRQLEAIHEFARKNSDWYEIALDPWHARKIIREGKLAVVLGMEVSNVFPAGQQGGDYIDQLDELRAMGLRHLYLAHETDSRFAGAAPHRWYFELSNAIKNPATFIYGSITRSQYDSKLRLAGFTYDKHGNNAKGLTKPGEKLVQAMMDRNMVVDMDHLSMKAKDDLYKLAKKNNYYPLFSGHGKFQAVMPKSVKDIQRELAVTCTDIKRMERTGGMLGMRPSPDPAMTVCQDGTFSSDPYCGGTLDNSNAFVDNNCTGSSRSLAQHLVYANKFTSLPIALGTDNNLELVGPRFGPEGCWGAITKGYIKKFGAGVKKKQKPRPDDVSETFNIKGYSHIGLAADLLLDFDAIGADTSRLDNSAEAFLKMWERTYDENRGKLPSTSTCK